MKGKLVAILWAFAIGVGATSLVFILLDPGRLEAEVVQQNNIEPSPSGSASPDTSPRNVILFVGDGMGISTITAARILEGQLRGETGEANSLSFEAFPSLALSKVYSADAQVPDSAATITALMSGIKTDSGVINVDPDVVRGDCTTVPGNELTTWMMAAERQGMATGVVTTSRLTDATPAGTYAVTADRGWENDAALTPECGDYPDIATQLLSLDLFGDGFEVALGGGRRSFYPTELGGARLDGRNLAEEWSSRGTGWYYIDQASDLHGLDLDLIDHLLGIFADSEMAYENDREVTSADQPSLTQMTELAIGQLERDPDGFALVVEAGRIDHAHHEANASRALTETIELSNAVSAAMTSVDLRETLIIVTADHGDVLTITGHPGRGSDILTVVGYGPETHSGDDVPIFAVGPGSDAVSGVREQSHLGFLVFQALGLEESMSSG